MDKNFDIIEEQPVDLRRWFLLFLRQWPLFIIGLVIAFIISFLYNSFSVPQYQLSINILVGNDRNPLDKGLFFTAFGNDPYQLENQKGILRSKSVTRKAINQLDFYTSYYVKERFRNCELYKQSPFIVDKDTTQLQPLNVFFYVTFISDSLLIISAEDEDVVLYDYGSNSFQRTIPEFHFSDTVKFGEITGNSFCRFALLPDFNWLTSDTYKKNYYFQFHSQQELTSRYRNFKISNDRSSSILNVSIEDGNPIKAADFLNKLTAEYLARGIDRDNRIAEATIRFIDIQLIDIVDSLRISGGRLKDFKSSNKALALDYQAEKVYTKLEGLEADKSKLLVKNRYFNYLLDNLKSKADISDLIAPTSFEINDPVINNLIMELAGLYSERTELSFNSIKDNPYLTSLERKISDSRLKLTEAARSVLEANKIAIDEINNQIAGAELILNRLPGEQQQLISIERKFKLNDELYTYLLTKRSDMEIFKASNLPKNDILDSAEPDDAYIVSPNSRNSFIIALILGLVIPGVLIYLIETINNKIRNKEDIQKLTEFPVVGQIIDSKIFKFPAALNQPNSELTESYRTLRTNLQFVIDESVPNIIMLTSAIKGEGKSFTALNLAAVYSFYGKKTILVDFDLRKSRTKDDLGINMDKGLSNYLSKNATLDQVIYKNSELNFHLICAGPVPPNPSELVSSSLTSDLFGKLKKEYDIIIVDTPPIGIVSDALMIYQFAEISLLVARFNYTSIEVFRTTIEDIRTRGIKKICIILNDLIIPKNRYGYGYGYGYIGSDKKRKLFNKT